MEKPAKTDHPIHELLASRWSPRSFADKPVPHQTLARIFEAARWAASCFNEQPWIFLVTTKDSPDDYQKALNCLVEFNQNWVKTAPVLVLAFARKNFHRNGKPNPHAWHDVGLAVAGLTVQATFEGLHVHQMAGIESDKIRKTYAIPDDVDPVTAFVIGYVGQPSALPKDLAERENDERTRNPQSDFVFHGDWKKSQAW